jgi:hypothetical protein
MELPKYNLIITSMNALTFLLMRESVATLTWGLEPPTWKKNMKKISFWGMGLTNSYEECIDHV